MSLSIVSIIFCCVCKKVGNEEYNIKVTIEDIRFVFSVNGLGASKIR